MKSSRLLAQWLVLCVGLVASYAVAAREESIVVDSNGDYIITYHSYLGWQKVKWIPATKINPSMMGYVRPAEGKPDNLSYRYTVRNGRDSRQFLDVIRLSASNVLSTNPRYPNGWVGDITLDRVAGSGFNVGWSFWSGDGPWETGIKPGGVESGFGFDSKDLPGIGQVALYGARPGGQSFPDEGPNVDSPIYAEFIRIQTHDEVIRFTAVPRISVSVPYDGATVITNIQKHLDTDLVSLKLVDPVFVAKLDSWFVSAIDAAKQNNTKALRHAIQELRRLLKQEQPDADKEDDGDEQNDDKQKMPKPRIDRLAARVLDFDLRYVQKRSAGDKD